MKSIIIGALFVIPLAIGCQKNSSVSPEVSSTSSTLHVTSRDSLYTGSYLGITIGQEAQQVYPALQTLQQTRGVSFLNVVSNTSSNLTQLRDRLPLYQYILLDQNQGTDSGVQITVNSDQVSSIYLNSGQKLIQWPVNLTAGSAIRLGDPVSTLYEKFVRIKTQGLYANKFERIFLLTKNLSKAYDPVMDQSPQWYFTYKVTPNTMDEVQVYFRDGKVSYLLVNHYKS